MRFLKIPVLLVLLILAAGCQRSDDQGASLADALPLDADQPTFALFYTDN